MVRKSSLQEIVILAIIREISDSDLETGRYGPRSPGLSSSLPDYAGELTALWTTCKDNLEK